MALLYAYRPMPREKPTPNPDLLPPSPFPRSLLSSSPGYLQNSSISELPTYQLRIPRVIQYEHKRVIFGERRGFDSLKSVPFVYSKKFRSSTSPLLPPPSRLRPPISPTILAGLLISAPVNGLRARCEVGFDGRSFLVLGRVKGGVGFWVLEMARIRSSSRTLGVFDPVLELLSPREQSRLVQVLIELPGYDGWDGRVNVTFRCSDRTNTGRESKISLDYS